MARHAALHGVDLQLELTSCQVEAATGVCDSRAELLRQIRGLRSAAAESAQSCGARLLAVALPPTVPDEYPVTDTPRYRAIGERFGMIAHEQGISGCHVHVAVPDREVAVGVCTRLRPWLPLFPALSANSALFRNTDTGHASWRHILWARWPSAGPPPHLESAADYDRAVQMLLDTGAALDEGMIYWDARPSANFPTVDVRAGDVPATATETVLLATLVRAAVMTAVAHIERGLPPPRVGDHELRARYWRCARDGLEGGTPKLLGALVAELRPALEELGEWDYVKDELDRVSQEGNGAMRQRRAWRRRGEIADVVADGIAATVR